MNATSGSASATTGNTRSDGRSGSQPATGSQRSQMPNTSASSGATTNTGIEIPATAKAITSAVQRPPARERGQYACRQAKRKREQHRGRAEREAHRQPVGDQLADGEVAELEGRAEVAVQQAPHVAAELDMHGLVEAVGRLEVGADLRRQRLLLVERAAGRESRQQEGERDDQRKRRYRAQQAPQDECDRGHPVPEIIHLTH